MIRSMTCILCEHCTTQLDNCFLWAFSRKKLNSTMAGRRGSRSSNSNRQTQATDIQLDDDDSNSNSSGSGGSSNGQENSVPPAGMTVTTGGKKQDNQEKISVHFQVRQLIFKHQKFLNRDDEDDTSAVAKMFMKFNKIAPCNQRRWWKDVGFEYVNSAMNSRRNAATTLVKKGVDGKLMSIPGMHK